VPWAIENGLLKLRLFLLLLTSARQFVLRPRTVKARYFRLCVSHAGIKKEMERRGARDKMAELGLMTIQISTKPVWNLFLVVRAPRCLR